MREFQGKRVLLAAPPHFGFNNLFAKELSEVGFDVKDFSPSIDSFRYASFLQRIGNFLRKIFYRDYLYKRKLIEKWNSSVLAEELRKYDSFDYALFVRPDMFPLSFVESVREKTACMSAYQWDGLSRYNEVNLYIEKFDRFFVFDETDLSDNLLPLTNFCAGSLYPSVGGSNEIEKSAFFLSSYDPARFRQSIELKRLLEMHKIKCEFIFVSSKRNKKQDKEIQINGFGVLRKEISYLENIRNVVKADIIIDICVEGHQGLSFRVFESLSLSKKLITTNSSIKQYDF